MSRRRAFLVAFLSSALLAPAANAAASTPPLQALRQVQRELSAQAAAATTQSARKLLAGASQDLSRATAPTLWIDPSDAIAPPDGHPVFADSRAALTRLEPLLSAAKPPAAITADKTQILAGDRALAERAIYQARRGAGLLFRAEGMVLSGDRWAETARFDLAAEQYGTAWVDAFDALVPLVVTPAATVPPNALASAAENALAGRRIAFSSVRAVRNKPPLTHAGLPEVVLVAPDGCASCAFESWGIVEALSQFGDFANLHLSQSAATRRPLIRGFTFRGGGYGSSFVAFAIAGPSSNVPHPLPFLDVANRFADVGSPAAARPVSGLTWGQVAGSLALPKTAAAQAIDGTAELLTAEICEVTGGVPATVCGAAAVKDYENRLPPATP